MLSCTVLPSHTRPRTAADGTFQTPSEVHRLNTSWRKEPLHHTNPYYEPFEPRISLHTFLEIWHELRKSSRYHHTYARNSPSSLPERVDANEDEADKEPEKGDADPGGEPAQSVHVRGEEQRERDGL